MESAGFLQSEGREKKDAETRGGVEGGKDEGMEGEIDT